MAKVSELPIWEDFPYPKALPEGFEIRKGWVESQPITGGLIKRFEVWCIRDPVSDYHIADLFHKEVAYNQAFWVRVASQIVKKIKEAAGETRSN